MMRRRRRFRINFRGKKLTCKKKRKKSSVTTFMNNGTIEGKIKDKEKQFSN